MQEQVTTSTVFLEGWNTSAFLGVAAVRRKYNRKAECLLIEQTKSNVWVLYHFPSVRMRCNARDIFMPMVAGLIPKDLWHFPLDLMFIHLNYSILVYQKNWCISELLMSTRDVLVLNQQIIPSILNFALKHIIRCLSNAAGTIITVLYDIPSCLCADLGFSLD